MWSTLPPDPCWVPGERKPRGRHTASSNLMEVFFCYCFHWVTPCSQKYVDTEAHCVCVVGKCSSLTTSGSVLEANNLLNTVLVPISHNIILKCIILENRRVVFDSKYQYTSTCGAFSTDWSKLLKWLTNGYIFFSSHFKCDTFISRHDFPIFYF